MHACMHACMHALLTEAPHSAELMQQWAKEPLAKRPPGMLIHRVQE